jgi:dihydrolipoamide dehydrogenase
MSSFDVAVIGSGPGGYVAAIRCSQLGLKTALIEKYNTLGGTCLNVGCIPSKSLLDSSHHFEESVKSFPTHGIDIEGEIKVNLAQMMKRKSEVVEQTTKGIDYLMGKNKITVLQGVGRFIDATHIEVVGDKTQTIEAKHTIIATGSKPASLPFVSIDKERIITSTEALSLKEIPKHLVVIGGGVIGLELGQVYRRLGAEVSVVEYADRITPIMDSSLSKELMKVMKKQGVKFYLSHQVNSVKRTGNEITITAKNKKEEDITFSGDYCLVSVGRKPFTKGLNLQAADVSTNERGQIEVNASLQTSSSNIYAIGDVVRGAMLAHKAEEEGVMAAEIIAGQKPHIDHNLIPNVIYTWPEVAAVGKTEEELKSAGIAYKSGQFSMRALGRARASMDIDGFVKILADKTTDEVLGIHIIGARAADLIAQAVTAMEFRASAEDIARMSHAHPTYAEAMKEAALAATEDRALHV